MTGKSFKRQDEVGRTALQNQAKLAKTKTKVEAAKKAAVDRKAAAAAKPVETKAKAKTF